jgi:excinuclease UvrABC helicase subunit UvrB
MGADSQEREATGDEIEAIHEFDPLTGERTAELETVTVYANSHYVTPRPTLQQAIRHAGVGCGKVWNDTLRTADRLAPPS